MNAETPLLPGEPSPLDTFEIYRKRRPDVMGKLVKAARDIKRAFGVECDIHTAYGVATARYDLKCSRDWLPAFVREIEVETELRFSKRKCRFDASESPFLPGLEASSLTREAANG